jgi:hypothetical protein
VQVKKFIQPWSFEDLGEVYSTYVNYGADIALDGSDVPYVVLNDTNLSHRARIFMWAGGTSWTDLGLASPGYAEHTAIAIDPSDGMAVVAFDDWTSNQWVKVVKRFY